MTKELLQQALDALTVLLDEWTPAREAQLKGTDVITALRSALAAPMPESVHQFRQPGCSDWYDGTPDHHDGHGPYEVRTLYAAPPAAPAPAVREEYDMADDGGCPTCGEDGGTSCGMPNCGLLQGAAPATSADYAMGYAEGFNDACKPAPVVREPLTDKQINNIADALLDNGGCTVLTLARAIEQAHGIGGGDK